MSLAAAAYGERVARADATVRLVRDRPVRIAITGAHGVGKSTLAGKLCAALALTELPTPGRTLSARGLPINQAATVASQLVAWLLQYRFEREQLSWVASRSLIDVWAYTALAEARGPLDPVEAAMAEELARATPLAIIGSYDELVYVRQLSPFVVMASGRTMTAFSARPTKRSAGHSLTRKFRTRV